MILVDTNVIIDYWISPDERLTEIFESEDIAICGIVEAELLHGARSERELNEITDAISCFDRLTIGENWNQFGRMLYRLRTSGVTLPFQDAVIAHVAISNGASVLTRDSHFRLIANIIPELRLYQL